MFFRLSGRTGKTKRSRIPGSSKKGAGRVGKSSQIRSARKSNDLARILHLGESECFQ